MKTSLAFISIIIIALGYLYFFTGYKSAFEADQQCHYELRLKSVEIGYSIEDKAASKLGLTSARFYITGTNLLTFSKFKLWDVEMGGNGLGYPIQLGYNFGINLNL